MKNQQSNRFFCSKIKDRKQLFDRSFYESILSYLRKPDNRNGRPLTIRLKIKKKIKKLSDNGSYRLR